MTLSPTAAVPGNPVVCIAEDRQSCEPALRILVASLARQCPDVGVHLFCPNASPAFADWLARFPQAVLNAEKIDGEWTKYDIKPFALLTLLRRGLSHVLWIDSDIMITRDFRPLFRDLPPETVAVTEEALCSGHSDPDGLRCRLWGMEVGRPVPFTANTGVIRVTTAHIPLLERWKELLESRPYRDAQALPWDQRGLHVMGDQEVFTALLSSAEFVHLPIRFLRRGTDILQFFGSSGYTLSERMIHLRRGLPPFIHSQGYRPWWPRKAESAGFSESFKTLYNDLSPYTVAARRYASELENPSWLRPPSKIAAVLNGVGAGRAPLVGMPLALASDIVRLGKTISERMRLQKK